MTDTAPQVAIQQINLSYDQEQDRLLLRVGLSDDSEINAWLTRRIVKTLWQLIQQAGLSTLLLENTPNQLHDESSASSNGDLEALEDDEEDSTASNPTFEQAYQARKTRFSEPLLAQECQLHTKIGGQVSLDLIAKNKASVTINLSTDLIQAITHMLQMATKEAVWDINFSANHIIVKEPSATHVLH